MKIIKLDEKGDARGKLVAVENSSEIPFDIKRFFYIYDCEDQVVRGEHANLNSQFAFVCLKGSCSIITHDGQKEEKFVLDNNLDMFYMENMIWKSMKDFSNDCILLILSDCVYDKSEYIYNFDQYLKMRNNNE